jgi:hypothetical protein
VGIARTRIARVAGVLATVAVALTAATGANAQLAPPDGVSPITPDGTTISLVKSPCVCQPVGRVTKAP